MTDRQCRVCLGPAAPLKARLCELHYTQRLETIAERIAEMRRKQHDQS